MIVPIPYVHAGMGLLAVFTSLPLIFKKVPMNHGYGIRIKKAFESENNWYQINAYGGKLILIFGLFLIGFSIVTISIAPSPRNAWAPVFLIAPLAGIIPVLVMVNLFAERLPNNP